MSPEMQSAEESDSSGFADLSGKCAVVTGSSSGIGRAIALELGAAGADVVIHARRSGDAASQVAEQIRAMGRNAEVILQDLAATSQLAEFVERAWQWRKACDVWVNNAGADVLTGPAGEWSFEAKLEQLWRVDVAATISLCRMVGPRMKQRGEGVILNMGWDQAEQGMEGKSGELFGPIKGAVMAFSRSIAQSLAPQVRVHCLAPGWIKTAWGETAPDYWDERARHESLMRRWGTPEDVARVARFLASPASSFMTGQVVPINGGFRYWQRGEQ